MKRAAPGEDMTPYPRIRRSESLPYIYNSNESGTKLVIPRDDTATHGVGYSQRHRGGYTVPSPDQKDVHYSHVTIDNRVVSSWKIVYIRLYKNNNNHNNKNKQLVGIEAIGVGVGICVGVGVGAGIELLS